MGNLRWEPSALINFSLHGMQGRLLSVWKCNQIPFRSQSHHPLISSVWLLVKRTLSRPLLSQEASLYEELHPLESLCIVYIESDGNDDPHNRFNNKSFQIPERWNGVEHLFKLNGAVLSPHTKKKSWSFYFTHIFLSPGNDFDLHHSIVSILDQYF